MSIGFGFKHEGLSTAADTSPTASASNGLARAGLVGGGGCLPYLDDIQRLFGSAHDLAGVTAHVGGPAASAADRMGAEAYAFGDHVAFHDAPSRHDAAHEAAHVVQQRSGIRLPGGVGSEDDEYERSANAVADRVAVGASACDLLPTALCGPCHVGGASGTDAAVQMKKKPAGAAHDDRDQLEAEDLANVDADYYDALDAAAAQVNPPTAELGQIGETAAKQLATGMVGGTPAGPTVGEAGTAGARAASPRVSKPTWNKSTFDCSNPPAPAGVVPKSSLKTYSCPNMIGKATTVPEMQAPLCRAAAEAGERGYSIRINESYRDWETQVKLWCRSQGKKPPEERSTRDAAVPGTSLHGRGNAVDVALVEKLTEDGRARDLTHAAGSTAQCFDDPALAATLAESFYSADPDFNRLQSEIWHFEYGTAGRDTRGKHTAMPQHCKKMLEKKRKKKGG